MSSLFVLPKEIPKHIPEVPMYRTTRYRTLSRRERNVQRDLDARVERYSKLLKVEGKPVDFGDRIFMQNEDYELEIYRASDSLLYSHKKLRYRTDIPSDAQLPSKKEAFEKAKKYLDNIGIDLQYAKIRSFEYTEAAHLKPGNDKPQFVRTEAHIIYSFSLDGLPVFGPGAKIKVSLVEENKISGLLYFWRKPTKDRKMPLIHPEEAIKRLTSDPTFGNLSPKTARVTLHNIQFGYYSLTPTDFQRCMIPVYAINGTVETEFLDPYQFTQYVMAVDISFDEIKKYGVVDNPYHCGFIP